MNKSNLIGAIVRTAQMKSDFSHYDDETEDTEVEGMIIEVIEDTDGTSYLVMDEDGLLYQTDYNDLDKIIRFTDGNMANYLRPVKL